MIEGFLYHGSDTPGIVQLDPRQRFTPGNEKEVPASVYATSDPAFAAAHAFPWSSSEGIDLYYGENENGEKKVCLEVPKVIFERLNKPVSIYTLDGKGFTWLKEELSGKTYISLCSVKCIQELRFNSAKEAIEFFGGKVIFV
jgi:hypothetical protein